MIAVTLHMDSGNANELYGVVLVKNDAELQRLSDALRAYEIAYDNDDPHTDDVLTWLRRRRFNVPQHHLSLFSANEYTLPTDPITRKKLW